MKQAFEMLVLLEYGFGFRPQLKKYILFYVKYLFHKS